MQIIKWTSLIIIMILATLLGNILSKKYKNREKELKGLKRNLNLIETKIKFTQQPLTEIFEEISKSEEDNQAINIIFKKAYEKMKSDLEEKAFRTIWSEALKESRDQLNLTDEDINIVDGLGKTLGTTDIDGQVKEIEITKEFIDNQIEKAEEERRKNEKMYKTLGGIAGIGIAIILI